MAENLADKPLKLMALDGEDLAVVSAHLQDAVLKIADMAYLATEKRFALVANRFFWEGARRSGEAYERRRTGLQVARVLDAATQGLDLSRKDQVLSLLAITFEAKDAESPEGTVSLAFSGGATIRLVVECCEVAMADLGGAWQTGHKPEHPASEDER